MEVVHEIWKDIPGYENLYQVSNLGNVRSFKNRNGRGLVDEPKLKKGYINRKGYRQITLWMNGKRNRTTIKVSVLVAMAFLGHTPNKHKVVVDHINENKTDDRLENLQLITSRENTTRSIDKTKTGSKYCCVTWHKKSKKWFTQINIGGIRYHVGLFSTQLKAHFAVRRFKKQCGVK